MTAPPRDTAFLEIEHKYVVPDDFDPDAFAARVMALGPAKTVYVRTRDTYFLTALPGYIFRHRFDRDRNELTVKSYGGDNRTRIEVNLALAGPDPLDTVRELLRPLGIVREARIDKVSRIFEFADCEIVYYVASHDDSTVRCVEVEAVAAPSETEALAVIARYEDRLGLTGLVRSEKNLFDLLIE